MTLIEYLSHFNGADRKAIQSYADTAFALGVASAEETYTDDQGTTWTRPTAWAYAQACKALGKRQDEIEELKANYRAVTGVEPATCQGADNPEWIDDPHDIEHGMMRNPDYKARTDPAMAGDAVSDDEIESVVRRVTGGHLGEYTKNDRDFYGELTRELFKLKRVQPAEPKVTAAMVRAAREAYYAAEFPELNKFKQALKAALKEKS